MQNIMILFEDVKLCGFSYIEYNFLFRQIQHLSNCLIDERAVQLAVLFGSIQIDLHVSAEEHILIKARLGLCLLLLLP